MSNKKDSQPPPYSKYEWESAEKYYYTFKSWPITKKLKHDYHVLKAIFESNIYNQPRELIEERKKCYAEASSQAKAHYKATKTGKLQGIECEKSRREVFEKYADCMNDIERWTNFRFDAA